jgi:hypothetical protein
MAGRDERLALIGQIGQKCLNLMCSHVDGVVQVVKPDIPWDSIDIRAFGPYTVVLVANATFEPAQQFWTLFSR